MKKRKIVILGLFFLLLLGLATAVFAVTNYSIDWSVIAGGGGQAEGGGLHLDYTIGQSFSGATYGQEISLASGFWPGAGEVVPIRPGADLFLPLISAP